MGQRSVCVCMCVCLSLVRIILSWMSMCVLSGFVHVWLLCGCVFASGVLNLHPLLGRHPPSLIREERLGVMG